jgi:flavin-binding protein dodecin
MVVKVIEVIGESSKSWEDAAQNAVEAAAKTVRNIIGIEAVGWTASVKDGKITKYKTTTKIAFGVG